MGSVERSPQTAFRSYKRARVDTAAPGEDRLSDLPDCLLHEILCRLGSRQAAQTGALSRRWRHVWRSTHCLHIDQRQFPGSDEPGCPQSARFEDFTDGMLAAFAGVALPLYEFSLHLVDGRSTASEWWMRRGLGRRPANVDICSNYHVSGIVKWPPRHLDMNAAACRLTRLRLSGVTIRDGFLEQLGAQCPVLEGLRLDWCHHRSNCAIFSPTLKSLEVIFRASYSYPVTLAIAAPRLASLDLRVPFSGAGDNNPMITAPGHDALPSLVTASINILDQDCGSNQRANKTKLEFLRSMRGFLARLSNVSNLRLCGFTTTALLDQKSQKFPVFRNLRELHLTLCDVGAVNSEVLLRILEGTPNLEKIGLLLCKFSGRPKSRKVKTVPKGTPSKRRASTLFEHENLSSVQIECLPNENPHWDKMYSKYLKRTPKGMQPRLVKKLNLSSSEGEVYTDAGTAPLGGLALSLYHRANITRDPVAATTRIRRRVSRGMPDKLHQNQSKKGYGVE